MNYGTLQSVHDILQNLEKDIASIGLVIALLAIVIIAIWLMISHDTSPTAHSKRWERLHVVLIGVGIIASASLLVGFIQQLTSGLHL